MVKNLPANARDTGLIPDLGKFHMLWATKARASVLLSLCSRAQELQPLKLKHPGGYAPQQEKSLQKETSAPPVRE